MCTAPQKQEQRISSSGTTRIGMSTSGMAAICFCKNSLENGNKSLFWSGKNLGQSWETWLHVLHPFGGSNIFFRLVNFFFGQKWDQIDIEVRTEVQHVTPSPCCLTLRRIVEPRQHRCTCLQNSVTWGWKRPSSLESSSPALAVHPYLDQIRGRTWYGGMPVLVRLSLCLAYPRRISRVGMSVNNFMYLRKSQIFCWWWFYVLSSGPIRFWIVVWGKVAQTFVSVENRFCNRNLVQIFRPVLKSDVQREVQCIQVWVSERNQNPPVQHPIPLGTPFTQDAEHLGEGVTQIMGLLSANGSVHTVLQATWKGLNTNLLLLLHPVWTWPQNAKFWGSVHTGCLSINVSCMLCEHWHLQQQIRNHLRKLPFSKVLWILHEWKGSTGSDLPEVIIPPCCSN